MQYAKTNYFLLLHANALLLLVYLRHRLHEVPQYLFPILDNIRFLRYKEEFDRHHDEYASDYDNKLDYTLTIPRIYWFERNTKLYFLYPFR